MGIPQLTDFYFGEKSNISCFGGCVHIDDYSIRYNLMESQLFGFIYLDNVIVLRVVV